MRNLTKRREFIVLWISFGTCLRLEAKRHKHAAGFSVDVPSGWTVEDGESGLALVPPGANLDPNREDNPEIYTFWIGNDGANAVENTRASLEKAGAKAAMKNESFKMKNAPASMHTFDFDHPERKIPYRIRIISMVVKGRRVVAMATGHREKLAARDKQFQEIARSVDVP